MNNLEKNSSGQRQEGQAYNWLNEHGQVNFDVLKKLAEAGTPEAAEQLHQLADDNNVSYEDTTDLMQLAQEIYRAIEMDGNIGVE